MNLTELGWDSFFEEHFEAFKEQRLSPARIAQEHKHAYVVYSERGEMTAEVSGKFIYNAASRADYSTAGDWVAVNETAEEGKAIIHALLPRKSSFSRKDPGGKTQEQVVAANVDTVFLVSGLDGGRNFNLTRIERYLTLAWSSGANPLIVLNKSDVCDDVEQRISEVKSIAFGIPIHPVSAAKHEGLDTLQQYLSSGKTVVLLGSSGVGKTTLINRFLGTDDLTTTEVRRDGKGRHTTTRRELIFLPQGGMVIDTPGMREIQLWTDEEGHIGTFEDIEKLVSQCRFRDCQHRSEPGCAIKAAIDEGALDASRYKRYLKQQKELRYLAKRQDQSARRQEQARWKKIAVHSRQRRKSGLKR